MRRFCQVALFLCLTSVAAFAEGKSTDDPNLPMWKWANFLILAGALGYLMVKALPPLFTARTQEITKDMTESQRVRKEADEIVADVEKRLSAIETEIASLQRELESRDQRRSGTPGEARRCRNRPGPGTGRPRG